MPVFHKSGPGSDQSGTALIEFALVFPLIIFIFFSAFGYGWLMFQYAIVQRIHFEAGRAAVLNTPDCDGSATEKLTSGLGALGIPFDPATNIISSGSISSSGGRISGYHLQIAVPLTCPGCEFVPGTALMRNYQADLFGVIAKV